VFTAVSVLFRVVFPDLAIRKFIDHNKSQWSMDSAVKKVTGELLFEYNTMHSAVIAYSYLAGVLASKHDACVTPFVVVEKSSLFVSVHSYLLKKYENLYKSFGADNIVIIDISTANQEKVNAIYDRVYPTLKTKRDIEKIEVNGVRFGDLIYDHYLRKYSVPTIDIEDGLFVKHLKDFLSLIVVWDDYLETHDVRAINVSHTVYKIAILPRLAISYGIPAYQTNATHVYCLSHEHLLAYVDFSDYPEIFKSLPREQQASGLKEAAFRLERRFSGEIGVDMGYSTKSAYTDRRAGRLLQETDKKKILIATHCFFDSPHPYGINLFPDFYEWLTFLGEISEITDYDWYIKTHPDFLPGNLEILQIFFDKYPKFNKIPSDSSHHQIIEEGIDVVLTVYGTIGFEYAAMGIPVVNASTVNPHNAYDFNLHPSSMDEYKDILMNLENINLQIDKHQVHEYYYMKHIYNTNDWLFEDYAQMESDLGGYREQFTTRIYDYYLTHFDSKRHMRVLSTVKRFVDSEDYRLNSTHMQ